MRLSANERRAQIIEVGKGIALSKGIVAVTHESIAKHGPDDDRRITVATVRRYFHTLTDLRDAVAKTAWLAVNPMLRSQYD